MEPGCKMACRGSGYGQAKAPLGSNVLLLDALTKHLMFFVKSRTQQK